jgi:hypothetical protein
MYATGLITEDNLVEINSWLQATDPKQQEN